MSEMLWLPVLLVAVLLLLAAWMLAYAHRLKRSGGLPNGKVIYDDVSHLARAPLVAARYGLRGKPDYLLQDAREQLIPVEVKSGPAPNSGRPYDSHLLQLAAYFLLVEDALDEAAPYGLIRYRNRSVRVTNSQQLRARLLATLQKMRAQLIAGEARRNHAQASRCARCSVAHACNERLA